MGKISVLFLGESWFVHTQETKGFDVFTYDYYGEGTNWISRALSDNELEFHHIPCHMIETKFPETLDDLKKYDVILASDVGANTFNLPMKTFTSLQTSPSKLDMIRAFVESGKGFGMIGGYLTFQGIQARGCYKNTVVEEILPVQLLPGDDRCECSQGARLTITKPDHAVLKGMPEGSWPAILGYNKLIAKPSADVVVQCGDDPVISLGTYGRGRTLAYATDCAPHWCPVEFCEWEGYAKLWSNLVKWLAGKL